MTETAGIVIAIDGPAGAGKSTAALRLSNALGYVLVDTGALYRGLALAAREGQVDWGDGPALAALAGRTALTFVPVPGERPKLHLEGVDRSGDIRTPEISQGASIVSKHPEVRAALLELQRSLGRSGGVVLEGRDIGTVVFPQAELKVFLTASAEARSERRLRELASRGIEATREEVLSEIRERDDRDTNRPVAPLKAAEDAVRVDSSELSLEEVVTRLVELAQETIGRN